MFAQIHSHFQKRTRAQAMVEFALALPIILAVVFGVLETGRLIYYVSAVNSASREAARFGSATGTNAASGLPYYRDCTNIIAKAANMSFGSGITASNVVVVYDTGPGTTPYAACPTPPTAAQIKTGDRIVVSVCTSFVPVVTIPFMNLSSFVCSSAQTTSPFFATGIVSTASRTILAKVDVSGATYTPVGGGSSGSTNTPTGATTATTAVVAGTTAAVATTSVATTTTAASTVASTKPVCVVEKGANTSISSGQLVFNVKNNSLSSITISASAAYNGSNNSINYDVQSVSIAFSSLGLGANTNITVAIKGQNTTPISGYALSITATGEECTTASYSFFY